MTTTVEKPKPITGTLDLPDNTFFGSDQHFGHANINFFCQRGFDTAAIDDNGRPVPDIDAMNADIVDKHNSVVGPDDFFVLPGDICMGKVGNANDPVDPKPGTLDFISQLNGRKVLVAGNHDKASFLHSKSSEKRDRMVEMFLRAGFEAVYDHLNATYKGRRFVINHFPYSGDHMEQDRYSFARPEFNGLPICHGHLHDSYKQNMYRGVVQANVGIDAHGGFPISIQKLMGMFDNPIDDDSKDPWVL